MKPRKRHDYRDKNTTARQLLSLDGRTTYAVMVDGSHRRISPARPWHGKSQRRQVIKARRERSEALAE